MLPPIIQQMIDAVKDKNTQDHIRFNYILTLEKIRDAIEFTLKKYKNK